MGDIGEEKEVTTIPEPDWDETIPPVTEPSEPAEVPEPEKTPEKVPA